MNTTQTTACCQNCVDGLNCMRVNCPCHSKTSTHTEEWEEALRTKWRNSARMVYLLKVPEAIDKADLASLADWFIAETNALLLKQRKETLEEVRKAFTDEDYQCGKHKRFLAHLATLESSNQ